MCRVSPLLSSLSLPLSPSLCLSVFLLLYASLHCWVDGVDLVVVVLRGKADLSALEVGDVDKAGGARGGVNGLEHGGNQGGAVGDLVELFGTKVVEEVMEGEDVFDGVDGRVGGEEVRHGGVIDGAYGYGDDLTGEVCEGEVVVEGREVWVLS